MTIALLPFNKDLDNASFREVLPEGATNNPSPENSTNNSLKPLENLTNNSYPNP
jgi:hypothetical protein